MDRLKSKSSLNLDTTSEYLTQAKALCKHGEWLGWLEANFEGSQPTASRYMQLYRRWDELELLENYSRMNNLSLSAALAQLAEPRPPQDDESETDSAPKPSAPDTS